MPMSMYILSHENCNRTAHNSQLGLANCARGTIGICPFRSLADRSAQRASRGNGNRHPHQASGRQSCRRSADCTRRGAARLRFLADKRSDILRFSAPWQLIHSFSPMREASVGCGRGPAYGLKVLFQCVGAAVHRFGVGCTNARPHKYGIAFQKTRPGHLRSWLHVGPPRAPCTRAPDALRNFSIRVTLASKLLATPARRPCRPRRRTPRCRT